MSEINHVEVDMAAAIGLQEDTMAGQYLAINLDDQQFGIPIEYITDIIQVQPITKVPNCPEFITGITNLRGKVIPIMDLRLRFGKAPQEFTDRTCIIVLEDEGAAVGMIVDSVSVVLNLDDDQISPPPTFHQALDAKFIQGVNRSESGVTLIMDCKTVLDDGALLRVDPDEY
ncbi:MAG: chemotaxis protein CheW [Oscillospiraceae bacterium]|nr:chemotaxis protein CheW [Oscillospiraceae bacterium]